MFNNIGNYKCICGKEFTNSQSFCGHKSHCEVYLLSKGLTEEQILDRKERSLVGFKRFNTLEHLKAEQQHKEELEQWLSEQHTCEKCGKVMTEKFRSGRFCSIRCANSHVLSKETKEKIWLSINKYYGNNIENCSYEEKVNKPTKPIIRGKRKRNTKPKVFIRKIKTFICVVCGKPFERQGRSHRTTCSNECLHLLRVLNSINMIKKNGYHKTIYSQYKFGTYKGFECDSSWELAFVAYGGFQARGLTEL